MKCVPGEQLTAMGTLFAIEFARGLDANEVLAWSDFFGVVTTGLIAIGNRRLYIEDPNSTCCTGKKNVSEDTKNNMSGGNVGADNTSVPESVKTANKTDNSRADNAVTDSIAKQI